MELSYKDLLRMPKMIEFANFANKAEKAIIKNYSSSFGINKEEIPVFTGSGKDGFVNEATLTIKGIWKFRHNFWGGGRDYEVVCTGEEIFNHFMKEQILKESGEEDYTMECALSAFQSWVENLPTWEK